MSTVEAPSHITALARALPKHVDDAVQLLDEPGLQKLAMYAGGLLAYVERAEALTAKVPTNANEEAAVAKHLSEGLLVVKELEATRRRHVDPLNEQVKATNALFKLVTDPIKALTDQGGKLSRAIIAFQTAERNRRAREEEEHRRKQEAAALAEAEAMAAAEAAKTADERKAALAKADEASQAAAQAELEKPRPVATTVKTESGTVSIKKRWTFEIVKPELVPREFLMPDEKAIRAAVAAGVREIGGVNIYEEDGLTRRPGMR